MSSDNTEAVVNTSYGAVCGTKKSGCYVFRGVPFAECPIRFKRPVPPDPWSEVRDCRRFGKIAIQASLASVARAMGRTALGMSTLQPPHETPLPEHVSENCLFLNITTTSLSSRLPVLCWIHGGAFRFGAGSDPLYVGSQFTRTEEVILVTINYRLGCFGFLNVDGGDANCGLWDQVAALRWIQSEIHNFGGDPERVTIAGESAGGMSCGILLTAPLAQPLFQRAILMSGALSNVMSGEDASHVAHQFCEYLGTEAHADALRGLTAGQLMTAQGMTKGALAFQPCIDGELVRQSPFDLLACNFLDLGSKSVILGTNVEEWNLFSPLRMMNGRKRLGDVVKRLAAHAGPSRMASIKDEQERQVLEDELRELFKEVRSEQSTLNWSDLEKEFLSELVFHAPARLAAEKLTATVQRVYVYSFRFGAGRLGAAHGTELPLLFGTHKRHWVLSELTGARAEPAAADLVSRALMASFASFARSGVPTLPKSILPGPQLEWPECARGSTRSVFVFDEDCRVISERESALGKAASVLLDSALRPFGFKPTPRAKL